MSEYKSVRMFRALNDFDILVDPLENGIASKQTLYDITRNYLEEKEKSHFDSLSDKEKEQYVKDNISKYIISHKQKIQRHFLRKRNVTSPIIQGVKNLSDAESYIQFITTLGTINNHLINGSRTYTDWISCTTSLQSLSRYYDEQDVHKIALINTETNGIFNANTFVVNLTSKDAIEKLETFLNKRIDPEIAELFEFLCGVNPAYGTAFRDLYVKKTNSKFMGFNFATHSKEICVYGYTPKENIEAIWGALEFDLIRCGLLNFDDFVSMNGNDQMKWSKDFKDRLKFMVRINGNPYLFEIFTELYLKDKNIKTLYDTEEEKQRVENANRMILKIASKIPDEHLVIRKF